VVGPNGARALAVEQVILGADPRRIMRLTFSRRAVAEMQRRVERITAQALDPRGQAASAPCRTRQKRSIAPPTKKPPAKTIPAQAAARARGRAPQKLA
jgi:superfamily I DNA/RNA helicase